MESERLRNSLLAALSHDLRTPLAALLGLAESLALTQPPLSAAQRETAHAIAEEARRLIALVNNLLDMARIQSGEVQLQREWHAVRGSGGQRAARCAARRSPRTASRCDLPRDLPLVEIDAMLIERVLVQPARERRASTRRPARGHAVARAVAGPMLEVTVADDGPGIPPGQEEAIFEKFTRGATESATPGVGLGLAICRAIVEAHSGSDPRPSNDPRGGARFVLHAAAGRRRRRSAESVEPPTRGP